MLCDSPRLPPKPTSLNHLLQVFLCARSATDVDAAVRELSDKGYKVYVSVLLLLRWKIVQTDLVMICFVCVEQRWTHRVIVHACPHQPIPACYCHCCCCCCDLQGCAADIAKPEQRQELLQQVSPLAPGGGAGEGREGRSGADPRLGSSEVVSEHAPCAVCQHH